MSVHLLALSFDTPDPHRMGSFWAGVLRREIVSDADGILLPGDETQVGLRFVEAPTVAPERNRLHLHVTSSTADEQRGLVDLIMRLGGRRRGTKPLPVGRDVYLADPDGNEFCLIAPGDDYLAGCGPLGEITCDGRRSTALFWRDALDWRVVWDRDEQLVIQSPHGGTKIAWDAWPDAPASGRGRQHFDLTASDFGDELARLVARGATLLDQEDGRASLADPGGDEFRVRPS